MNLIIDIYALIIFSVHIYGLLRDRQLKEMSEAEDMPKYEKILQVFIHIQTKGIIYSVFSIVQKFLIVIYYLCCVKSYE